MMVNKLTIIVMTSSMLTDFFNSFISFPPEKNIFNHFNYKSSLAKNQDFHLVIRSFLIDTLFPN